MSTPDEERATFEAWALSVLVPLGVGDDRLRKTPNGAYINDRIHYAWFGWRARATTPVLAAPTDGT